MKKQTWYEVFVSKEKEGTKTIANFDTKKEAVEFKRQKESEGHMNLFIDRWEE